MMTPANEEFQITRLGKGDVPIARDLFMLMQQVFEVEDRTAADESHIEGLLLNDHFICFAAWWKGRLAGGLTAYELPMVHSGSSEIFIYDIALKAEFQRTGHGKRLLQALREYATGKKCSSVFVDAHVEDEHALEFYRATGGAEASVIQFTYR